MVVKVTKAYGMRGRATRVYDIMRGRATIESVWIPEVEGYEGL